MPASNPRVFLESRYKKFDRELPQTIFWCPKCRGYWPEKRDCSNCQGFGKLTKDSVQELLARVIQPLYRAKDSIFHGAGREDVDVRMLGNGRPFVFELTSPRTNDVDVARLHELFNRRYAGRVEVAPFQVVPRARVRFWKEACFEKVYRVLAQSEEPFVAERCSALVGRTLSVEQHTPQRVAHRRADLARIRAVTVLAAMPSDAMRWHFDLRCEHGTYVKEWVSGDAGRTRPSLSELVGVPCRCVELDVLEILTGSTDDSPPTAQVRRPPELGALP